MCAALTFGTKRNVSDDLTVSFLLILSPEQKDSLAKQCYLSRNQIQFCLSLSSRFHFPGSHEIIQTSQWHHLARTRGYLIFLVLWSLPPTAPRCSLCSCVWCLFNPVTHCPPSDHEFKSLISPLGFICSVLGVRYSAVPLITG